MVKELFMSDVLFKHNYIQREIKENIYIIPCLQHVLWFSPYWKKQKKHSARGRPFLVITLFNFPPVSLLSFISICFSLVSIHFHSFPPVSIRFPLVSIRFHPFLLVSTRFHSSIGLVSSCVIKTNRTNLEIRFFFYVCCFVKVGMHTNVIFDINLGLFCSVVQQST